MTSEGHKPQRCAIYTRTSSVREQAFSSNDAQHEYCAEFAERNGWKCVDDRYDDEGYSGGKTNRPAYQRLMADVEAGKIDCIIAYKYERASRSMRDFLNFMAVLDSKGITFASATQPVNSATSAGRMFINAMMMVAQFERENGSERTRDKIAASRKRGQWSGGRPVLGYNANRQTKRLERNEGEAEQVKAIFLLYIEREALLPVVQEVNRRGWRNKRSTTSKGATVGGRAFDKCSLYNLLTNVLYAGRVRHKDQTYPGEHEAIIEETTFQRVQELLQRNGRNGGAIVRNKHGALLKGLLHCAACNCSMGHSYSKKPSGVLYRYYLCQTASKVGWESCPAPSVPAGEIEAFVMERIRDIARDPRLVAATVRQARDERVQAIKSLESEQKRLKRDRTREARERLAEITSQLGSLRCTLVTEKEVRAAFARFDELWATLAPHEQAQVIQLLVKRIEWDGKAERIKIIFHPTGLRGLAEQDRARQQEAAA